MSTMHPTDINAALINLIRQALAGILAIHHHWLEPDLRPIMALQDTRTLPFAEPEHRPSVLLVAGCEGTPRIRPGC